MFAKKEQQFMNKYMKNSTNAINNGDKMSSDDFQMNADEKRTLVAGEWRIPISELNHLKQIDPFNPVTSKVKATRNSQYLKKGDSQHSNERSKATPLNQRIASTTSTMAMTARHNPGSAFSQARSVFNRSPPSTASKLKSYGALIQQEKKPTGMNLDLNINH